MLIMGCIRAWRAFAHGGAWRTCRRRFSANGVSRSPVDCVACLAAFYSCVEGRVGRRRRCPTAHIISPSRRWRFAIYCQRHTLHGAFVVAPRRSRITSERSDEAFRQYLQPASGGTISACAKMSPGCIKFERVWQEAVAGACGRCCALRSSYREKGCEWPSGQGACGSKRLADATRAPRRNGRAARRARAAGSSVPAHVGRAQRRAGFQHGRTLGAYSHTHRHHAWSWGRRGARAHAHAPWRLAARFVLARLAAASRVLAHAFSIAFLRDTDVARRAFSENNGFVMFRLLHTDV